MSRESATTMTGPGRSSCSAVPASTSRRSSGIASGATGEVGVAVGPGGDAVYTLHPGRAWEVIEVDRAAELRLATARAFCFCSLAQRTAAGHAAHMAAIDRLPAGAKVVLDVNLRSGFTHWDRLRRSLERATVVKLNDVERDRIAVEYGVADPVSWLLEDPRTELVALTRGPDGCALHHQNGTVADHPGYPAEPGGDNIGLRRRFCRRAGRRAARGRRARRDRRVGQPLRVADRRLDRRDPAGVMSIARARKRSLTVPAPPLFHPNFSS